MSKERSVLSKVWNDCRMSSKQGIIMRRWSKADSCAGSTSGYPERTDSGRRQLNKGVTRITSRSQH